VGGAEGVVFGLGAFCETGEAAALAEGVDAILSAGEDFVRVALVADIPDELVVGGVEDGVDGGGEFDDAEARAQVAAGFGDGLDRCAADFVGEGFEFLVGERFHVGGRVDAIEDRCGILCFALAFILAFWGGCGVYSLLCHDGIVLAYWQ